MKKTAGQTMAQSHEQEMSAETDSKRIKRNGNQSGPSGKAQIPQDPSQWTEAHAKIWSTKLEKELREVLAPKARTATQNAITTATIIQEQLTDVANEKQTLAEVRKEQSVEDYVKSVLESKKALAHQVTFIKKIKTRQSAKESSARAFHSLIVTYGS